jgi:hypothetical protein
MSQYHDYILEHMSHDRLADARRQADADRWVKRSRKAQAKGYERSVSKIALIQSLLRHLFGWQARVPR